jgi:hypothetical protein
MLSVLRLYTIDARMTMNVEQFAEWNLAVEIQVLGENLPQCHFSYHISHVTWPVTEQGPSQWEAGTNYVGYGTAWKRGKYK